MTEIEKAIREQDPAELERILQIRPQEIDEKGSRGIPMALQAAETGNLRLVKYIVEYSRASMNLTDDRHRNMLHYAAASGSVELCRYLVEKVGMDIFAGDIYLVTPYQIACESGKRELADYFREETGCSYEAMYRNPIRRGMFPDPSIVCVGEDFYMVNSSFVFFPCIPISHSRDLIHWEIIGHAITDPSWSGLGDLEGGRGYWAPDISYDAGRFYITATYRLNDTEKVCRRQIIVSADRPEGPYTEPVYINEDGIDPSLFHEDGRHYMLLNRGARILELDESCTRQISKARLLYYGDQKRAPEGPHLLKKDGWYYLFLAEGGTGPGHRISVARSRELYGRYEPCPYDPIMRQEDEGAGLWRCGHGKPVQTANGKWYMVYLCSRKLVRKQEGGPAVCSILGRETALDPIEWTADGWPLVNHRKGPSVLQYPPGLPEYLPQRDETKQWMSPREPETGGIMIRGNKILLKSSREPLSSVKARNICLRRQTEFDFDASVKVLLTDREEKCQAVKRGQELGLVCYYDENSWVSFGLSRDENGMFLQIKERIGIEETAHPKTYLKDSGGSMPGKEDVLTLTVETRGLDRRFAAMQREELLVEEALTDVYYLCDEGISMGKRFTGACVGVYACAGEEEFVAEFENFLYEEKG